MEGKKKSTKKKLDDKAKATKAKPKIEPPMTPINCAKSSNTMHN